MKIHYNLLVFLFLLILLSCSSNNDNAVVPQPNITAKISGYINLEYQGSGVVTQGTLYNSLSINLPSAGKLSGKTYSLGIFLINKDFKEKTGTFIFSNKDIPTDYAVGFFELTENGIKKSFFADSGSVTITQLSGTTVAGLFSFRALDSNSVDTIWVMNGKISF